MLDVLDLELLKKGFKFLERDSVTANDFADNIRKAYKGRILLENRHGSKFGEQVFFRINLIPEREK